jgi:FkbM family methyltransferase
MSTRPSYCARVKGVDVIIPGKVFGLARELYGRMPYFAAPGFGIKLDDVVVDLGANCGLFSVLAAKLGGVVYAVEAQHGFIKELRQLALVNGIQDKIITEWGIVGPKTGVLSDCERIRQASHWMGQTPPVLRLSTLFDRWKLSKVDFLKIDIEGSEFDLIADDPCFLDRVRKIAMEIHLEHGNWRELAGSLLKSGFQTLVLSNDLVSVHALSGLSAYLMAWRSIADHETGECGF